jgi:intracellular septation protein
MSDQPAKPTEEPEFDSRQLLKMLVELGPLIVFFTVNAKVDIYWGTGCFVAATVVALIVSRFLFGKVPTMPLISGAFVIVFGSLTLWLHDDVFIKIKPTVVNSIFALTLFGGLYYGKSLLKYVFGDAFKITDEGWRKLTFRWACFFVGLAVMNEVIWRTTTTDTWVNFKVFGIMPITMIFAVSQMPLLKRYEITK